MNKNLFDPQKIRNLFEEIKKDATIEFIEVNSFTLEYLKSKGIYSIADKPLVVNNNLLNYEAKVYSEKFNKPTEYETYIVEEEQMNKDMENLKAIVEDLEDAEDWVMTILGQEEIESLKHLYEYLRRNK